MATNIPKNTSTLTPLRTPLATTKDGDECCQNSPKREATSDMEAGARAWSNFSGARANRSALLASNKSADAPQTEPDLSDVPGQGDYTHAYVLVAPKTTGPTGHTMMAFGDANGPQVVFNQGGAGGGLWGDDAKISRMSWDEAKEYLIPEGIDYQVHSVTSEPENIRAMFDSMNGVFEAAEGDGITRTRDYNVFNNNCTTLTRDALRAGGMDIDSGIIRPIGLRNALDAQAKDNADGDGVDVHRSMIVHGAEGQEETASPWTF